MRIGFNLPEQVASAAEAESMLAIGLPREEVLAFLRARGMSKIDTMRVLADATGISLIEAKNVVQGSKAWR